jgi:hypothetical protein
VLGGSAHGQLIDLTQNELTAANYNPAAIVRTANQLIAAGEETAHASLVSYSLGRPPNPNDGRSLENYSNRGTYVAWLCLLLYDPKSGFTLETPMFGAPSFPCDGSGHLDSSLWPKFPLALSKGIPFQLVAGYELAGETYTGDHYADLYRTNGVFRSQPYAVPTRGEAETALNALISSPQWKSLIWKNSRGNEEWEKKYLHDQVQRISP